MSHRAHTVRIDDPLKVTLDYQYIVNPGYNRDRDRDRGPVSVFGIKFHVQI